MANKTSSSYDFSYAKRGIFVRLAYLVISALYGVFLSVFGSRSKAVILCYHAVTDMQRARFHDQMRWISQRSVSMENVASGEFFGRVVAVTFDDAFECLIENVVTVVDTENVPITIFAVTENMGCKPKWGMDSARGDTEESIMTFDQLRIVNASPQCSIGSHTETHPKLALLEPDEVRRELHGSKSTLEQTLAEPIDMLAFPHGSYNDLTVSVADQEKYKAALTLDEKCVFPGHDSILLGRFSASPDMWMIEFKLTINGAYAWLYHWRRLIRKLRTISGKS